MVDEVRREIERIQGYISSGRLTQFDEANTKATAIEPILRELDWNVVDPDEVTREYSVGNRSVDYALFCDDTLKVFIEAKNGGESLERHQQQLLDYAFAEGVEIAGTYQRLNVVALPADSSGELETEKGRDSGT